ncbi:CDP-glycerol glycerophosphotransferase family protein [Flexivirga sp. B27]
MLARVYRLIALAIRLLPPLPIVVVHGFADDEENSLRLAAAMAARRPGRWPVVLLCANPAHARQLLQIANRHAAYPTAVPRFVRKDSPQGVLLFVLARVFCYTHHMFGAPDPGPRRVHVNVGHGHGPKWAESKGASATHRADLAMINNAEWGGDVVEVQGLARGGETVVLPNPREDALREPADRHLLRSLGVDPERPVVMWLPTYRRTIAMRKAQWQDGSTLHDDPTMIAALERMSASAHEHGIQLLTKFHKLDSEARTVVDFGMPVVTQEQLDEAGLSFYQLLTCIDGMISDYSSVYVDYLSKDNPVALFFLDYAAMEGSRGFNSPDFRDAARELILTGDASVASFFAAIAAGEGWRDEARHSFADAIGFAEPVYPATLAALARIRQVAQRKGVRVPASWSYDGRYDETGESPAVS